MKTPYLPIAAMGLALSLSACDNEAELALRPAVAEFALETLSYSENDGSKEITIALSKPAREAGSLTVSLTSDALAHFNFSPAPESGKIMLDVAQGSSHVGFRVESINNDVLDGLKLVSFSLVEASRGLQVGLKNRLETTWVDDESPSHVAFALQQSTLAESAVTGSIVTLTLSHASPGDGQVSISFSGNEALYGRDFTTIPAADNKTLVLPVAAGATQVSFVIDPLNDALFNADRDIQFKIESLSPVLDKGAQLSHTLTIKDDELSGRPKSYSSVSNNGWAIGRTIIYGLDGRIERVIWQNATPGQIGGERLYSYNDAGLIERVDESSMTYIKYIRENGRIVKEEEYDNEELDQYTIYGYDQAGNIGEVNIYDRQSDGSFVFSLQFVYLYFSDGNVYKKMAYSPRKNDDPVLISTQTYENYIDAVNPFPLEIVHGQPIQNKLPSTHREEIGEEVYEFSLRYEFLPGGLPSLRNVTGHGVNETTRYEYY